MIVRAGVVPHPPLLVPELVGGTDDDVTAVRSACLAVATRLTSAASRWVAVGSGPAGVLGPSAAGTFAGFGVDVPVRMSAAATGSPDPAMPLSALVTAWLREQAGATDVIMHVIPPDLPSEDCFALGERLAGDPAPVGLLIAGDGSHRHGDRSPGRPDDRAGPFDDAVHEALRDADAGALRALDPKLADELGAAGRAPWQVLAGAMGRGRWTADARLLVPFGVAYHLAVLDPVP
ncbi:class III extradiol dioxygenase subunit B-like domain-containing protein [Actinophytocola sp.]|uniref:class III extradiol dioxygenase subunit B-like domain-containing protein n=1 Tax=Actinophytocola sp. TaxID=1872138 RepID=UPI002D2CA305|nr:class III extradiol dioxygenase subunit B-like domain-containing protein [Actinophytocola sp.]HYQ62381.1 class III extradiol dioxygenase subunit B-like domain-containing protein [Actinophytocola sp.]